MARENYSNTLFRNHGEGVFVEVMSHTLSYRGNVTGAAWL